MAAENDNEVKKDKLYHIFLFGGYKAPKKRYISFIQFLEAENWQVSFFNWQQTPLTDIGLPDLILGHSIGFVRALNWGTSEHLTNIPIFSLDGTVISTSDDSCKLSDSSRKVMEEWNKIKLNTFIDLPLVLFRHQRKPEISNHNNIYNEIIYYQVKPGQNGHWAFESAPLKYKIMQMIKKYLFKK